MHVNPPARALGRVNAIITTTAVPYLVERFPGPLSIKWMAAGWATSRSTRASSFVNPGSATLPARPVPGATGTAAILDVRAGVVTVELLRV